MSRDLLNIFLGDIQVGEIHHVEGDKTFFIFTDEYRAMKNRPVLSQSFLTADLEIVDDVKAHHMKLHPFFSNLLPEGQLRSFLAMKYDINEEREYFLLNALGEDVGGAVIAKKSDQAQNNIDEPELAEHAEIKTEELLHFSLAGVQLKFSAHQERGKGLVIPAHGMDGDWIVKLEDRRFPGVVENEYTMMKIAEHIGLEVPKVEIFDIKKISGIPKEFAQNNGKVYAVKRFDREANNKRIHVEDFAQVFGIYPHHKYSKASYSSIAKVLKAKTGSVGVNEFVRRLAFNMVIANGDMHLKNWSLIYRNGIDAQLAPAYDLLSTIPYIPSGELALSLGGSKKYSEINEQSWRSFADDISMTPKKIVTLAYDTIAQTLEAIEKLRSRLPANETVWEAIHTHNTKYQFLKSKEN